MHRTESQNPTLRDTTAVTHMDRVNIKLRRLDRKFPSRRWQHRQSVPCYSRRKNVLSKGQSRVRCAQNFIMFRVASCIARSYLYGNLYLSSRSESLAKKLMRTEVVPEMIKCSNCIFIKVFLRRRICLRRYAMRII